MSPEEKSCWLLVLAATSASISGSCLIYVDALFRSTGHDSSIMRSSLFISCALGLSGGTLLVTALYSLMPSGVEYIKNSGTSKQLDLVVLLAFASGSFVCLLFNTAVHSLTSKSIVHCAHTIDEGPKTGELHPLLQGNSQHDTQTYSHATVTESLERSHDESLAEAHTLSCTAPDAHSHFHTHLEANSFRHPDPEQLQSLGPAAASSRSSVDLLSIGLQTAVGIAVHRVPEGFLLFATSRADSSLRLPLVLSLSIHSFSEGFTIAVPIYGALGSRFIAWAIAVILGGGSQPLGALLAALWMEDQDLQPLAYYKFGVAMLATSGFMATISVQMITTAAITEGSQRVVLYMVLVGMMLVLATRCL